MTLEAARLKGMESVNWKFLRGQEFTKWRQIPSKDLPRFLRRNEDAVGMLLMHNTDIEAKLARLQDEYDNLQLQIIQERDDKDTSVKGLQEENYQLQMKIIDATKDNERLAMVCCEQEKYKARYHVLNRQLKDLQGGWSLVFYRSLYFCCYVCVCCFFFSFAFVAILRIF